MTNATLGFVEEMNAQAALLKDGMIRKLPVKRDGKFLLNVVDIVPGDVVFLRGGNVIPADGKWLDGDELAVDQAALTGESLPVAGALSARTPRASRARARSCGRARSSRWASARPSSPRPASTP